MSKSTCVPPCCEEKLRLGHFLRLVQLLQQTAGLNSPFSGLRWQVSLTLQAH